LGEWPSAGIVGLHIKEPDLNLVLGSDGSCKCYLLQHSSIPDSSSPMPTLNLVCYIWFLSLCAKLGSLCFILVFCHMCRLVIWFYLSVVTVVNCGN